VDEVNCSVMEIFLFVRIISHLWYYRGMTRL